MCLLSQTLKPDFRMYKENGISLYIFVSTSFIQPCVTSCKIGMHTKGWKDRYWVKKEVCLASWT